MSAYVQQPIAITAQADGIHLYFTPDTSSFKCLLQNLFGHADFN